MNTPMLERFIFIHQTIVVFDQINSSIHKKYHFVLIKSSVFDLFIS